MNIINKITGTNCYIDKYGISDLEFLEFLFKYADALKRSPFRFRIPVSLKNEITENIDNERNFIAKKVLDILEEKELVKYYGSSAWDYSYKCYATHFISKFGNGTICFITSDDEVADDFEKLNQLKGFGSGKNIEIINLKSEEK